MKTWVAILLCCPLLAQEAAKPHVLTAVCADTEIAEFGLDCTAEEPCPIYLELTAVEALGTKLFLAGNFHTGTVTLWSVLLASEDEGKTWAEPLGRIRGAVLDQVQFVDFENGWTAGHVTGNLPKDPFFLKTTDAGKTWRRIPIFEDTAYGSVESFWFTSKTQGELIINRRGDARSRYQRLQTMTGADSWMMQEVSAKPLPNPRPRAAAAAASADWRIRADGPSKSLRVERREAGRWRSVAAFQLRAGACQAEPAKPQEQLKPQEPPQPQ
ncbi:MAG: hypothetical protein IPP47_32620 [Bryobacterales bacterium]|nr:hypothetical protein [Bryobacterales bacterium]